MDQADIVEAMRRIPPHRAAMARVLTVLDDPKSSACDVAQAATPDAGFCVRLLRFANSAYFGLAGRVGSVERAVATVGASVVRSLAVSTAAGLLGDGGDLPSGFWAHCAAVGASAALVAEQMGGPRGDALCAGLLHDLGAAVAYRHAPDVYAGLDPGDDVLAIERERFGADHGGLAAIALAAWHVPDTLVSAVRDHHQPVAAAQAAAHTLLHALVAGEALARRALGDAASVTTEPEGDPDGTLAALGVDGRWAASATAQVEDHTAELSAMMQAA